MRVKTDDISRNLHHDNLVFIGTGQFETVAGGGKNTTYILASEGAPGPLPDLHIMPGAGLHITDPKHFKSEIAIGTFSSVQLDIGATSYTYDAAHDLLRLYQGNRVVDTLNIHSTASNVGGGGTMGFHVQGHLNPDNTGFVLISTGYTGLANGLSPHV